MINLVCESTLVLVFYMLFRRLFLNRVSRKAIYIFGLFPVIGLLWALFFQIDTDFWILIATRLAETALGILHYGLRLLGIDKVPDWNYSTFLKKILGRDYSYLQKIWLAGIAALICYRGLFLVILVRKAKKNSLIIEDETYPEVIIRESPLVKSPFLFWNTVFIPMGSRDEEEKFRYMMLHEYGHYKNGDPLWNFFRVCFTTVFWFQPLVWIACRLSKSDSEFACDKTATEGLNQQQKNAYCVLILSMCTGKNFRPLAVSGSSGLTGSNAARRIKAIKSDNKEYKKCFVFLLVLCVLLVASGSFTMFRRWKQQRKAERHVEVIEIYIEQ